MVKITQTKNGGTAMKAKIDLEKFICSLMKRFYKIHNIDPLTTKCWLDKVLEDQGLEYRDGEIVEIPQDSEDERIKKEILDLISISGNGNQFEEIKDWLEYKPQGKTALEAIKEEKSPVESLGISPEKYEEIVNECIYGEEKTDNNVEPKFHEGEWVVDNECGKVNQITSVRNQGYDFANGDYMSYESAHKELRLWSSIADAKDGDVLCYKDEISLYKHDIKNCTKQETTFGGFVYHCCYDGKRFITDSLYSLTEQDKTDIHPATEEQRGLLFAKMKEAGYEWDAENKELKKIEQKLVNSENIGKNDTLLDLLQKMPSCVTVDGLDYHFVMKKTSIYIAYYKGNKEEYSGNAIFGITAHSPIDLLTEMLEILKEKGLL